MTDPTRYAFEVVKDEKVGIYNAIVGGQEVAGLTYDVAGDRLVLLAASVLPLFRKQGIATELIRRVLDDVRAQGKTVTIMCPIVRTFIENNPEYADLIDPEDLGVTKGPHRTDSMRMTNISGEDGYKEVSDEDDCSDGSGRARSGSAAMSCPKCHYGPR
jgi:predicted GNAT family acetyltransferase